MPNINSLSDLKAWVESHRDLFSKPGIFLLVGEMAAGKTTLVSQVVQMLSNSKTKAASPTFALHHRYQVGSQQVDHMDLYRLENDEDLHSSGLMELLEEDENLFFIEWADRLPPEIFKGTRPVYQINFRKMANEDSHRTIEIKKI